jgi:hypothetical protein
MWDTCGEETVRLNVVSQPLPAPILDAKPNRRSSPPGNRDETTPDDIAASHPCQNKTDLSGSNAANQSHEKTEGGVYPDSATLRFLKRAN